MARLSDCCRAKRCPGGGGSCGGRGSCPGGREGGCGRPFGPLDLLNCSVGITSSHYYRGENTFIAFLTPYLLTDIFRIY